MSTISDELREHMRKLAQWAAGGISNPAAQAEKASVIPLSEGPTPAAAGPVDQSAAIRNAAESQAQKEDNNG